MKKFITIAIAVLSSSLAFCQQEQAVPLEQTRIVFNGAYIVMHDKADLVIQNSSKNALTVKNDGGIISEDAANNVIWNIGNDSGYSVPFISKDLKPIPVSFNTSNATGPGTFTLSTYSGSPDWKNADYLPGNINNVNRNGKDNSQHVIDRFWKISPAGYTSNPRLKNLSFSYTGTEWNESSNVITEADLVAQNWSGTKWLTATGKDNVSSNLVKISSVNNYYSWWTLVDSKYTLNDQSVNFLTDNNISQQTTNASVFINQNFPNPFSVTTTINYSLPQHFSSAKIIITGKNGNALKEITLSNNKGFVNINATILSSGAYQYSLYVDGRLIDTKQMILSK